MQTIWLGLAFSSRTAWLGRVMSGVNSEYDVVVVGGGAAGLFCAAVAGQRGRRVLLVEHNDRVGKKIGISGGGRCNFTNLGAGPANYLSEQPGFCRSALARYTPQDFLALVEKHGIAWHEKKLGQLFCNGSSREIIDLLLRECADGGVEVLCSTSVAAVENDGAFRLRVNRAGDSRRIDCESLVVATGGLSFAKLGATDWGHRLACQFGLRLTPMRPALVPLVLSSDDLAHWKELAGVSLPVRIRRGETAFSEAVLFTHRGLSGPAVLQISSYWRDGETVTLDLLPGQDFPKPDATNRQSSTRLAALLARHWPRNFADAWCGAYGWDKPLGQLKDREIAAAEVTARAWRLSPPGSEGYPKAEVTLGGVDVRDLSSKTMEARDVSGLYFVGEVMDVTGWLGGYNFQWAWASGHAAGSVV